ncbi:MAG TPA: hypothetical protein VK778_16395 [Solirubrobacteraceae bacterium]|jgi:hypothetical protein|nr:hypothetical protein [Solirubrobacteraceae bacterium]
MELDTAFQTDVDAALRQNINDVIDERESAAVEQEHQAERERHADEITQVIGRAISNLPGCDAATIAETVHGNLSPEQRDSIADGGSDEEVLAELRNLVSVEQAIRDA